MNMINRANTDADKTLWKLRQIGERMWILASMLAQQAAALGNDGRGVAVVADETRSMTDRMQNLTERALFDGENVDTEKIRFLALQINLIAINCAIESFHLDIRGKQTAVCAEDMRKLAAGAARLLEAEPREIGGSTGTQAMPWPKNPMSTVNQSCTLLLFTVAGIPVKENLANIREIVFGYGERSDGLITLRGAEYPVIDGGKMIGTPAKDPYHIVLRTPWAKRPHQIYAVAADSIECLFACPAGTPVAPPADMPLAQFVRECWENENGTPFYFMDWEKMGMVIK